MPAPVINIDGEWGLKLRPQTIQVRQGEDYIIRCTVREGVKRTAKNLTAGSVRFLVGVTPSSGDEILKITGGGVTIPVGTDGVANITIEDTDTGDLEGTFFHEVEAIDSDGSTQVVAFGRFVVAVSLFLSLSAAQQLGIAKDAGDKFGMVIEDTFVVS